MNERNFKVLHVEDEPVQQLLIRQILERVPEFRFSVVTAAGEEEAVAAFRPDIDAVVLDYHLSNGNGLSCLKRLRQASPHVPIVALSGSSTKAVAAELLAAGADDYFSKDGLDAGDFGAALGRAIARSAAWSRPPGQLPGGPKQTLQQLSQDFLAALGDDFFRRLAEFEQQAKKAGLSAAQIERSAQELAVTPEQAARLRPLFLELAVRMLD